MALYDYARLTVEAPVYDDDSKNPATGVFEFQGDLEFAEGIRTGYLVGGQGSVFNAIVSGASGNRSGGFTLDLGGGARTFEVQFAGWQGTASTYRWGDGTGGSGDANLTQGDAEGAHPSAQMDVLLEYLSRAELDSRSPATLEYSQHTAETSTLYEPWSVIVESPEVVKPSDRPSIVDGSLTFVNTADVNQVLDAEDRPT